MGRVEVKIDGKWGTVSDRNFGMGEANVACRAAGFGTAVSVQNGSQYGRGIGQVHHHNLWYVPSITAHSICRYTHPLSILGVRLHKKLYTLTICRGCIV